MNPVDDRRHMARALQLARRGLYTTDPNPRVGCVLVRDGQVIGEGFHRRAGEPHAERHAIEQAGKRARGATAYVTLEPCCHHGRTPPCTDAMLDAGIARLVVAADDPNPLVAGQGLARLQAAGVAVEQGLMAEQARALNPGFERRMREGRPYVRLKLAASADGRTAMASGESRWITSEAARRDVHRLRARSSAILTGVGTMLADDPSLNVRLGAEDLCGLQPGESPRQPLRVIADSRLRMPTNAQMLSLPGQTLIAAVGVAGEPLDQADAAQALRAVGAEVEWLPADATGALDLRALLRLLAAREINELLIESGPTLAGAALQAGLVDELWLYQASHLMGDAARGLCQLQGLESMAQRLPLQLKDVRQIGPDLRLIYSPAQG